jgi:hypothetical protein
LKHELVARLRGIQSSLQVGTGGDNPGCRTSITHERYAHHDWN